MNLLSTTIKDPDTYFMDLKKELGGVAINEKLWRIVDSIELSEKNISIITQN